MKYCLNQYCGSVSTRILIILPDPRPDPTLWHTTVHIIFANSYLKMVLFAVYISLKMQRKPCCCCSPDSDRHKKFISRIRTSIKTLPIRNTSINCTSTLSTNETRTKKTHQKVTSTEYTELQPLLSGVHSVMRVKISPGWWGWGVHAHPLSLHLPSPVKLQCTLPLSGQTH